MGCTAQDSTSASRGLSPVPSFFVWSTYTTSVLTQDEKATRSALVPCGKWQQGDVPSLLDSAGQGGVDAWCKRRSAAVARSCPAPPQSLATAGHRGMGSRQSFRYRTCTPSCGGRTCHGRRAHPEVVRRERRRAGRRYGAGLNPSHGLGPELDSWGAADTPVSGALPVVSSDMCFLFTLFASAVRQERQKAGQAEAG